MLELYQSFKYYIKLNLKYGKKKSTELISYQARFYYFHSFIYHYK